MTGDVTSLDSFPDTWKGFYRTDTGQPLFFGNMFGSTHVAWHDLASGQVRVVSAAAPRQYVAGPSLLVSHPIEYMFTLHGSDEPPEQSIHVFHHGAREAVAYRVPLRTEPVVIPRDDAILSGTLYLPITDTERSPAVVLVHGSGPQTRHMVQLYAETLCSWGVAALAYDKRGTGYSAAPSWDVDYEILAADAAAAVEYARHHTQLDPERIGLLGGSQAGWVMPLTAVHAGHVAFLIMLSGPMVPVAEQNVHNVQYNLRAMGLAEPDIQAAVAHVRLFNHVLTTGEGWDAFQQSLAHGKRTPWAAYAWPLEAPPTRDEAASIRRDAERDPIAVLRQVHCPVLAIFGGSDTIVPPAENVPRLVSVPQTAPGQYTIEIVPEATHTFLKSATGADAHMPNVTHMDLQHLAIIQQWLDRHLQTR
jgi:uncharacterized protein